MTRGCEPSGWLGMCSHLALNTAQIKRALGNNLPRVMRGYFKIWFPYKVPHQHTLTHGSTSTTIGDNAANAKKGYKLFAM